MKFEEVLPLMREGKKAQMEHNKQEGDYWLLTGNRDEFCRKCRAKTIKTYDSFNKMRNDDMCYPSIHGITQWDILDETWEIID